jgi:hypothetical protein
MFDPCLHAPKGYVEVRKQPLIIKVLLRQAQHDNSENPRAWDFFSNLLKYAFSGHFLKNPLKKIDSPERSFSSLDDPPP